MPDECIDPAHLQSILGDCPHLHSLAIKGEPCGLDTIHINHSKLEILEILCQKCRPLDIDCPNLTTLYTYGDENDGDSFYGPISPLSFNFPRLTKLCLSPLHCTSSLLHSMAVHAPDITRLDASFSTRAPLKAFTHFHNLRTLRLDECDEIPAAAFSHRPHLESLLLCGSLFAEQTVVKHHGLRSLDIRDWEGLATPTLACFALEELHLQGDMSGVQYLNLNSTCPKLVKLVLDWDLHRGGGVLELCHNALQELDMRNQCYLLANIACSKLKILKLKRELGKGRAFCDLPWLFVTFEWPGVTMLTISGYKDPKSIPWLLSLFQNLRVLEVESVGKGWREVMLEHPRVETLVISDVVWHELK